MGEWAAGGALETQYACGMFAHPCLLSQPEAPPASGLPPVGVMCSRGCNKRGRARMVASKGSSLAGPLGLLAITCTYGRKPSGNELLTVNLAGPCLLPCRDQGFNIVAFPCNQVRRQASMQEWQHQLAVLYLLPAAKLSGACRPLDSTRGPPAL